MSPVAREAAPPDLATARRRVVRASLELAAIELAEVRDEAAFAAVSGQLARYARDLVAATDALPADEQPSGWGGTLMEIRLRGSREECAAAAKRLPQLFDVSHQSPQERDQDRTGRVRVYVEAELRADGDGAR